MKTIAKRTSPARTGKGLGIVELVAVDPSGRGLGVDGAGQELVERPLPVPLGRGAVGEVLLEPDPLGAVLDLDPLRAGRQQLDLPDGDVPLGLHHDLDPAPLRPGHVGRLRRPHPGLGQAHIFSNT